MQSVQKYCFLTFLLWSSSWLLKLVIAKRAKVGSGVVKFCGFVMADVGHRTPPAQSS